MNTPIIRKAKVGDEAAIHEAHMRSIREICVKDHGPDEIKGWGHRELNDRWTNQIKRDEVWVVELEGKICGLSYLRIFEHDGELRAHLHALYLTPEVMGQGFGSQLTELMLAKARDYKVKIVTLESSITAHEFYKRKGFVDTSPMQKVDIGGYPVTCFPMALRF